MVILSADGPFAETVGRIVARWGFRPTCLHHEHGLMVSGAETALFDIREGGGDIAARVRSLMDHLRDVEVILINRPDNVAAAIAGMRAGAQDEVMVPIDTEVLHGALTEALTRRRRRLAERSGRKSLLSRFSEAMMAATFAQAGDFDGALELLGEPEGGRKEQGGPHTKNTGS